MLRYGFRICGSPFERRRLVDAGAAFRGYCDCDSRIDLNVEAYLSAFRFGDDFRRLLESTDSTAGFSGPCWAPWLWFDIDRANNLDAALANTRRLAASILDRYRVLDDGQLLAFFSGSKGFHVGLPTALWAPPPSALFHQTARTFAEAIAAGAGVAIDSGVYDRVRAFRAPNSRHPKTGLHKRQLSHAELMGLPIDRILELARQPEPFDLPEPPGTDPQAIADWQAAERGVAERSEGVKRNRENGPATRLNRSTLDFLRDGASEGDRHRLLFSAAANLAEFACPPALAHALLTDAALDAGLAPKDARRQIDCGLAHGRANPSTPPADSSTATETPSPCAAPSTPPADLPAQLAALWATAGDAEPVDPDAAAERKAIAWEGSQRWTPEKVAALLGPESEGRNHA